MTEAYLVIDEQLEPIVRQHWIVERWTPWDDSGRIFIAVQHDRGGVFDLVIDEEGVRLSPDADV